MEPQKQKINTTIKSILSGLIISIIIGTASYLLTKSIVKAGIFLITSFFIIEAYLVIKKVLEKSARIKKMEDVFPDFIELMASNLRAGMTVDKALLLSSRKEFNPLDKEILVLGKEIITGKDMAQALTEMAKRTKSDKILKTTAVINSGIKSGGNLAILLEQTALNMRERSFLEKKATSNILMYLVFIFFAASVGSPILFALSTVLVQTLTNILGSIPEIEAPTNIPFVLTSVNISPSFIVFYAVIFIIMTDILASLLLGLINKGEEKVGLKYIIPLILVSMASFFLIRIVISSYIGNVIG